MRVVLVNEKEKVSLSTLSNTGRLALGAKVFALVVVAANSEIKSPGRKFWCGREMLPDGNYLNRKAAVTTTLARVLCFLLILTLFVIFTSIVRLAAAIHITGQLCLRCHPVEGFHEPVQPQNYHAHYQYGRDNFHFV
jgi:hypothetical protein